MYVNLHLYIYIYYIYMYIYMHIYRDDLIARRIPAGQNCAVWSLMSYKLREHVFWRIPGGSVESPREVSWEVWQVLGGPWRSLKVPGRFLVVSLEGPWRSLGSTWGVCGSALGVLGRIGGVPGCRCCWHQPLCHIYYLFDTCSCDEPELQLSLARHNSGGQGLPSRYCKRYLKQITVCW